MIGIMYQSTWVSICQAVRKSFHPSIPPISTYLMPTPLSGLVMDSVLTMPKGGPSFTDGEKGLKGLK